MLALLPLLAFAQQPPEGEAPPTLYRVDIPDYPGALATSHRGSVLESPPPAGTPWRQEPLAQLHTWEPFGDVGAWEAVEAMAVGPWHDQGWRGQGVKVAVFDLQWFGAALQIDELGPVRTQDCWAHPFCTPAMDTLRPRFGYEQGGHGLACAEVVRDIAPDVELYLVRVNGLTTFENATRWAIREGIDVATLSMSFFNDSFYDGTGPVARAVEEFTEGGVLLVTSAGNYADGHWDEPFTDTDGDGWHEFEGGLDRLPVWLRAGRRGFTLQWDNYGRCGDTDLDVYVYNQAGDLLYRATAEQSEDADSCKPVERANPEVDSDQWGYVRIFRKAGDPAVHMNLISQRGEIDGTMPERSVTDPGTHPLAFTVGAVRAEGYLDNGPEPFSSWGPTFAGDPKPDIAAPDGLSSTVYGPTGFYGTSAASPAAAAAIALVMSREPELSARQAADRLVDWAVNDRHTWQEPHMGLGAGKLRLPPPEDLEPGCARPGAWRGAWIVLPLALFRRRQTASGGSRCDR